MRTCADDCKVEIYMFSHARHIHAAHRYRRNDLSDFKNIRSNGKIAIDMDEGETLVNVRVCAPEQHILLSARSGKCIRFPVEAIRVFKSRKSTGVRGIRLKEGDEVVSVSILDEGGYTREQREAYLKAAPWKFDEGEEKPGVEVPDDLGSYFPPIHFTVAIHDQTSAVVHG